MLINLLWSEIDVSVITVIMLWLPECYNQWTHQNCILHDDSELIVFDEVINKIIDNPSSCIRKYKKKKESPGTFGSSLV